MSEFVQRIRRVYNSILPESTTQKIRYARSPEVMPHVETFDRNGNMYYCKGWVFSKTSETVDIKVSDSAGRDIPFYRRTDQRPDVSKLYFGDERTRPECGFFLQFELEDQNVEKIFLTFSDKVSETVKDFDLVDLHKSIYWQNKTAGLGFPYPYYTWFLNHERTEEELAEQRATVFEKTPLFSILVPIYNTPEKFLYDMVDSCIAQSYGNWELCLADGSPDEHIKDLLAARYPDEPRIRYHKLSDNAGISANTNGALAVAQGDFIVLLDHDDLLAPDALFEFAHAINEDPQVDMLYSDEDKVYESDIVGLIHFEPHFKPDFNIDLLRSNNYICHLFAARKSIVDEIGGFRSEFDGAQDHDLALRVSEKARHIKHVPRVLYHWRAHEQSTAINPESKRYAYEAGTRAIQDHLDRLGLKGTVKLDERLYNRVDYELEDEPLVSIIIPNKDEHATLRTCLESLKRSTYKNYEVIIVENNSTEDITFAYYDEIDGKDNIEVIYWPGEFNFSKIINFGVERANGDLLLLLNNDTEVITEDWIEKMVMHCQRPEVAAVGALLFYPDDTIQHAGVIIGHLGIAGHAFLGLERNVPYYFNRPTTQQDLTAVTAACMMVKRSVFEEVGGFEEQLAVAFNDVDFCLKIHEAGYLIVYEPAVQLHHFESKTRGDDLAPSKRKRFEGEVHFMEERWHDILEAGDPNYNPNLSICRHDYSPRINTPGVNPMTADNPREAELDEKYSWDKK